MLDNGLKVLVVLACCLLVESVVLSPGHFQSDYDRWHNFTPPEPAHLRLMPTDGIVEHTIAELPAGAYTFAEFTCIETCKGGVYLETTEPCNDDFASFGTLYVMVRHDQCGYSATLYEPDFCKQQYELLSEPYSFKNPIKLKSFDTHIVK